MKLFCRHRYVPVKIDVREYTDNIFAIYESSCKTRTTFWIRCSKCGKVKTNELGGTWSESQLRRLYLGDDA